jgi:hypothetical protein
MVRGLFGEVRDGDRLVVASDAVCAARGCRGRRLERGVAVFDLPVTLQSSVVSPAALGRGCHVARTLKNSPRVELYGLQGLPLTYFWQRVSAVVPCMLMLGAAYQVLGEPEAQAAQHAPQVLVRVSNATPVSIQAFGPPASSSSTDLMNVSGLSR